MPKSAAECTPNGELWFGKGFSSAGFSLWVFVPRKFKSHRLKPALRKATINWNCAARMPRGGFLQGRW